MLSDPLSIALGTVGGRNNLVNAWLGRDHGTVGGFDSNLPLHINDIGPGSSQRVYDDGTSKWTLTISHSETSENKPLLTRRTLIRFDKEFIDTASGRTIKASAYIVCALPVSADFIVGNMAELARSLAFILLFGPSVDDGGQVGPAANDNTLERVLAGEP